MTLTFDIHIGSCTHLVNKPNLNLPKNRSMSTKAHDYEQTWYYSRTQCCLYTKFQGHWPFGSREEDVFLPYMGMATIFVM